MRIVVSADAGEIVVVCADVAAGDGGGAVTLALSIGDEPQLAPALLRLGGGAVPGVAAQLLGDVLAGLVRRMPAVTESERPPLAELVRTVVAACLVGGASRLAGVQGGIDAVQRENAEAVIVQNIASARLDVARISELSGISRSALYRLFEPDGGVAAYTRRLRLELAHRLLSDPARVREPIASVAEACGYHCVASFNRAFRSCYGCTPGDVRTARRVATLAPQVRPPRPAGPSPLAPL